MDLGNRNKLQALHNLLDKELSILQQQLNTETDQGHLFKNSYLKRIKQAEENNLTNSFDNSVTVNRQINNRSFANQNIPRQYAVEENRIKMNTFDSSYLNEFNNQIEKTKDLFVQPNQTNLNHQNDNFVELNNNKQKQTFITDYGSQISFQQKTSQHNSQQFNNEGCDTEQQQEQQQQRQQQRDINFTSQEDNNDPFTNINLQKEISGLQQKIQFLELKFNQSSHPDNNDNNIQSSSGTTAQQSKQLFSSKFQQIEELKQKRDALQTPSLGQALSTTDLGTIKYQEIGKKHNIGRSNENESNYKLKSLPSQSNTSYNQQSLLSTVKSPKEATGSHLKVDEYLNNQNTYKRLNKHSQNTPQTTTTPGQERLSFPNKDLKEQIQFSETNLSNPRHDSFTLQSSSKSPSHPVKRRSISSRSSRIIYQGQENSPFDGLEKEIEGAEYSLDISKRSLKHTLNKNSSRSNLKTDTTVNKSNYSSRMQNSQNAISKRSASQKSQRERSLSQGNSFNVFFPIDNYAQQYHESVELKQRIAQIRKQYETEKEVLNEEREKNKVYNEDIDRMQIKIKKISMLVEKNQQNEKDYYKLLESYNKSESIRKQQKELIAQLKDEIEYIKNSQNKQPIMVYDNGISSKRRNSKRLSTSSSQKYPKKI